jgi:hypothetical protein
MPATQPLAVFVQTGSLLRRMETSTAGRPSSARARRRKQQPSDVVVDFDARRVKVGQTAEGTVLALCR